MKNIERDVDLARKVLDQCFAASLVLLQLSGDEDEYGDRNELGEASSFTINGAVFIHFKENAPLLMFDPSIHYVGLTNSKKGKREVGIAPQELFQFVDMFELAFFEMIQLIHQQIYGIRTDRYL